MLQLQQEHVVRLETRPGAGDGSNSISGGEGANNLSGGAGGDTFSAGSGSDTISTGGGSNSVTAGGGTDSIVGGGANDSFSGGAGTDTITGGGGTDTFFYVAGDTGLALGQLDRITDFAAGDVFEFGLAAGSGSNYAAEATVADFAAALAAANTAMDGTVIYAAYAVGADVFVFADTNADGTADQAVFLAGSTLADVSSASFI
ncbi:MAG: hypothetical protein ACK53I_12085 [Phenylobacterium sp.]